MCYNTSGWKTLKKNVHTKIGIASFVNLLSYPIFVYHCNF